MSKTSPFNWVADSALYSKKKILAHGYSVKWLTRVPESIADAKGLTQEKKYCWSEINKNYKYVEVSSTYAEVRERWIVIESK